MIKKLLFPFALGAFSVLTAQETGVHLNSCASDIINQKMLKENPESISLMAQYEKMVQQTSSKKSNNIYTIPLVVHVMHKGEAIGTGANLSDADIQAKIRSINEGYRKTAGTDGDGDGVDIGIQFALAVTDPSGNPTSGINRFDMSAYPKYLSNGVNGQNPNSTAAIPPDNLKALSFWDSNLYYNIWIVSEIDNSTTGIQGFALYAAAHGKATDGMIVLGSSIKDPKNFTATHELGHALNLYHTFEGDGTGNTCPSNDADAGDHCADTPAHKRTAIDCKTLSNSCYPEITDLSFTKNFMSYSYEFCKNMFTPDQKNRMVTALTSTRQSFLSSNSANKLVPTTAPVANFSPSEPFLAIAGTDIRLNDKSSATPNTYLPEYTWPNMTFDWTINNNSITVNSTEQNPKFSLANAGVYNVSHTVNNGLGESSKSTSELIYVCDALSILPSNTLGSSNIQEYGQIVRTFKFKDININTTSNINQPYTDLSNTNNTLAFIGQTYPLTLAIKAGSGSATNFAEYAAVYIDYNNNGTFEESEKVASNSIPANTGLTTTVTNVTIPAMATKNTLLRIRVMGNAKDQITNAMVNGKASLYMSDSRDFGIYITDAPQSLGKEDYAISNLNFYPNPVKDIFRIGNNENIERVEIYNMMGQLLKAENFQNTNIQMSMSDLITGTYIATIYSNGKKTSIKVLKN